MTLLGIDIGTTHCKAGLFNLNGTVLRTASRPMITRQHAEGWSYFDPDEMLNNASLVVQEVIAETTEPVATIGIASMAETGLLVDRKTGVPRTFFLPWFDTAAQIHADRIQQNSSALECYLKFGVRTTFKTSLAKILWLCEKDPSLAEGAVWLSAADYLAYRLCGMFGTDYSLAGRTLAFRVQQKDWDRDWLQAWGVPADIFPAAVQGGAPLGRTTSDLFHLPVGIPVAVCGHDHVCAALAMGATNPGIVFDSIGTAETIIGALPERALTEADFQNGLHYGCHVAKGRGYWMGGVSASGGSLEWFRALLGTPPLTYAELETLLESASPEPTSILYFSYLLGSGSPHSDPYVRAAFVGLDATHGRADILKAVLEGVAYEVEFIRRAGEQMTGHPIPSLIAAGGGTRYRAWMQIKADVSGCQIEVSAEPEATLLGAALAAGIGAGLYTDEIEAHAAYATATRPITETFFPNAERHKRYKVLFENGYLRLQAPLREVYQCLHTDLTT